jgi:uncharacterized membrane protein
MYSKVKLAGHPVHAMLVSFPIACYTAACVAYAAYALGAEPFWFRLAVYANIAGVITAAIAALPGFIDWAFGVPSGTPAKRTGLIHMSLHVVALLAFAINAFIQWPHRLDLVPVVGVSVILSAMGLVLTVVAGFLGWKLVQVHHVGVSLTAEQERLEPSPGPSASRDQPMPTPGHGHRAG